MTPLQNMTVEQLEKAADDYAEKYDERFQKVARNAFMEAVSWAIQFANRDVQLR